MSPVHDNSGGPSPWIVRWSTELARGRRVLDVACGGGRHCIWFAGRGHQVLGVDRDLGIERLPAAAEGIEVLVADLEGGAWPLAGRQFDVVVVTNYLHRPLLPTLVDTVAAGGWLLYETFAVGNARFGKPSNPDFLLRPGELLEAVRGSLRVVAFEDVEISEPRPAMVQRIAARRE